MNQTPPAVAPKRKTGLHVVYIGIACLLLGYAFLAKGDISIAPFLLIGAFVVMGVGIGMGWD